MYTEIMPVHVLSKAQASAFSGLNSPPHKSERLYYIPEISYLTIRQWKIHIAAYIPNFPMSFAIFSSFS